MYDGINFRGKPIMKNIFAAAILAFTLFPLEADAACTLTAGPLVLEKPRFGDSGAVWAGCLSRDLEKISTSAFSQGITSSMTAHTIYVATITALFNEPIFISSPISLGDGVTLLLFGAAGTITTQSSITASAFVGDGSLITGISAGGWSDDGLGFIRLSDPQSNVGIGITATEFRLHVTSGGVRIDTGPVTGLGDPALFISSLTGRFGIGTDNPLGRFEVQSQVVNEVVAVIDCQGSTANCLLLNIPGGSRLVGNLADRQQTRYNNRTQLFRYEGAIGGDGSAEEGLFTFDSSSIDGVIIRVRGSSGHTFPLMVWSDSVNTSVATMTITGGLTISKLGVGTDNAIAAAHISSGTDISLLVDGDSPTAFRVGSSTMIVLGSGRVGIGTSNPQGPFEVESSISNALVFTADCQSTANCIRMEVQGSPFIMGTIGGQFQFRANNRTIIRTYAGGFTAGSADDGIHTFRSDVDGVILIAKGASGQTFPLQHWRTSNNLAVATMTVAGDLIANSFAGDGANITNILPINVGIRTVLKELEESVTASTVQQVDDELTISVLANTTYFVVFGISIEAAANQPDFSFSFQVPTGSTITFNCDGAEGGGSFHGEKYDTVGEVISIDLNSNVPATLNCLGWVEIGSSAGDLEFFWSQLISNATPTRVLRGAFLKIGEERP